MSFLGLWLGVGLLGGAASIGRVVLDRALAARSRALPIGTMVVNLSGTVTLGVLVGLGLHGDGYLLGATAVIGSYTTFSTWLLESHRLAAGGGRWLAGANLGLGLGLGILAVGLGRAIAGG